MSTSATRRTRIALGRLFAAALGTMAAPAANAASLQQVSDWGVSGLPSDVSMYIYVPDDVAATPPILALIHYCGGTASAVFGQAQGGGIVRAADRYGFIMVVPSSGRCWDVQSNRTRTRDGLGDSHAIVQMVRYAIETRSGNAQRVYATGDSSGGMMTELLLALYPDVFKAGSAMAGMPAGCRGANESGTAGGYSGACAGGSVMHTPAEWGDIARMMHPGYAGHRPRVQLFHGDADTTIRYANHTEAIEQWTNVLGLSATPTSTTTLTLGNHQATRQSFQNACGQVVLDGFTSLGGDHGPSDALFLAEHVIPFLGLDKTSSVDPEVEACAGGGSGGAGGRGAGGAGNGGGAASGQGGLDNAGAGGSVTVGGNGGSAAGSDPGGSGGAAGTAANGGSPSGGNPSGGASGAAGAEGPFAGSSMGGRASSSGGNGGQGTSGSSAATGPSEVPEGSEASGCGCGVVGARSYAPAYGAIAAAAFGLLSSWRRRRSNRRRAG